MKECDILGSQNVKTYSDPSYILSGGQVSPTSQDLDAAVSVDIGRSDVAAAAAAVPVVGLRDSVMRQRPVVRGDEGGRVGRRRRTCRPSSNTCRRCRAASLTGSQRHFGTTCTTNNTRRTHSHLYYGGASQLPCRVAMSIRPQSSEAGGMQGI